MILFIIILTLFIYSPLINAQEFSLYSEIPVLKKDSTSTYVSQPFISKKGNEFSAWFADGSHGKANISRMKSINGIDWYDKKILQLSDRSVGDPFMLENNNEYQLYFASSVSGPISIWKSTSSDGVTFNPGQEKEILKPEQSWERFSVSAPALIQDQSTQYLFYSGAGQEVWAVGMATSMDGVTWHKCDNNPIAPEGSGPQVVKYADIFYLFYHSSIGLQVQQTNILNGCNTVWSNRHVVSLPLMDPSPIVVENDLWIYGYISQFGDQGIGLAGNVQIPKPAYPIILIPGMFASWNSQALLHNASVSYDTWKLNPYVSEYEAIVKTLENKGRTLNADLFVFPYDWREPITETAQNLNLFIENKIWNRNPYQPIQLVGHSLGGVVGRIYVDQNLKKPIKQLITAGSPHLGAVQAYKPLVAGEIDRENTLMWMAEKLILLLNKSGLESDKDTVAKKLPILFDIFPAFPFLKDEDEMEITSTLANTLIPNYPIALFSPVPQLFLGGTGRQSLGGYVLGTKTQMDTFLGIYDDGHPVSVWTEDGDGDIVIKSTLNQITPPPTQNHGELIYSKTSIKTILSKLDIQVQDSDIPVGKATNIFPAILSFIQSPATIQISHNGITTEENEGMIWIQNAENGEYRLKVSGTGEGEYTASVWLIGETDDKWIQFKKTASIDSTDIFTITFDSETGGTAQEYIAPSPTPFTPPTPSPTLSANSQSSSSLSSSSSSNTSSQANQSTQEQDVYPSKKDYRGTSFFTPSISSAPNNPKILGASVDNKNEQKKSGNLSVAIILSFLVPALTLLLYWRKITIKQILFLWRRIIDLISTK